MIDLFHLQLCVFRSRYRNGFAIMFAWSSALPPSWPVWGQA